ncbi:MAG TPA: Na-K-Cl cotransporter [Phycisphaerae bacterium]|nr:Na-K-Cl cotransporter [Phycisphaerae bacterium]
MTEPPPPAGDAAQRRFGTFVGVFTPSVLTILGVIMYLRFGWVVASVGAGGAMVIVAVCSGVSFITALSASAVATNMPLGAGGEYFLISRSLGLTIGGAIGIPLFLCRTMSVTLYCFGLAEAVAMVWPAGWGEVPLQWIAGGLIVLITAIAGRSAAASLRIQIPLMAMVGLSLLALAIGVFAGPLRAPRLLEVRTAGFWTVLAVFFPAVTGFTAGIGMSGDLKDPQRSIPRGTLAAVGLGAAVYLLVPILLASTGKVTAEQMASVDPSDQPLWTRVALWGGWLVFPGMWGAILSSAFGSALAGPRVLQALARDGLAPPFLARASRTGQPTVATWVAGAIALSAVALGNLNAVAIVVTIFFLTLYLSINLAAAAENLAGDPSYRPTLHVPWYVPMLGCAAVLAVMFLISPLAGVIAIAVELVIWGYLRRRAMQASWDDVWAGLWGSLARFALRKLTGQKRDPRSWRPNILLFADQVEQRAGLVRMSAWFNQNRGVLAVCDVLVGRPEDHGEAPEQRQRSMSEFLQREGVVAFGEVDVVEQFEAGVTDIVQASGVGGLRANTIVFGWPPRTERLQQMLRVFRRLHHLGKSAIIIRPNPPAGPQRFRRIDIWWRGRRNNGDLMLLLGHLLTLNPVWRRARITIRTIVTGETGRDDTANALRELIASVRIEADFDMIVRPEGKSVVETIHETSRDADVVFLGLLTPEAGQEPEYARRLAEIVAALPTTVLVRNSGPFAGKLI